MVQSLLHGAACKYNYLLLYFYELIIAGLLCSCFFLLAGFVIIISVGKYKLISVHACGLSIYNYNNRFDLIIIQCYIFMQCMVITALI